MVALALLNSGHRHSDAAVVLDREDRLIARRGEVDLQMAQAVCSAGHSRLGVLVKPVPHSEEDSLEWDDRS